MKRGYNMNIICYLKFIFCKDRGIDSRVALSPQQLIRERVKFFLYPMIFCRHTVFNTHLPVENLRPGNYSNFESND